MKKNIHIGIIFIILVYFSACATREKVVIPEDIPEAEMQRVDEEARELKRVPLTKRQGRQAMRKREQVSERTYEKHHDRIQTKETRKRMKKNKKKSSMSNDNKKPGRIRKLLM
ncbi:MAG: hypothetical protein LBR55_06920 [Bacteroidales bacterium]|jgi:type IV secretory pathway VirB10-like protein|nr:hypothetical protein [Bacteroidales bacterium]